jgi:hypothetical protein
MRRIVLIAVIAIGLLAAAAALVWYTQRPTVLEGDPWDYNLTQADLPDGWRLYDTQVETVYDVTQATQAQPKGLLGIHSAAFSNAVAVDVFEITSQVILYDTPQSARAALAEEVLNAEWEREQAPRVIGEETVVWRLKFMEDAPDQAVYRVDARYLNGIISVTLTGTVQNMPDSDQALAYADKMRVKMQRAARPAALQALKNANRPDLRGLLLTQAEIAQLDSNFGDRWVYNSLLPLGWTPNSEFANPEGMAQLGRVMGYQVWLVKPLAEDELEPDSSTALFQQVTAYRSPEQAEVTLGKMIGLESGAWEGSPEVGESAKGWTQVYEAAGTSAGSGAVAATEISFRVGSYIGSIRTQTSPVTESEAPSTRLANEQLANQFAVALAEKLIKVGNSVK